MATPRFDATARATCAALNRRFARGAPSSDWAKAGVLMWTFDGNGHPLTSFPDATAPWAPNQTSQTGDRHSAVLVNRQHPTAYSCPPAKCGPDARHLPGLVLAPTEATVRRVLCLYSHDVGSVRFVCPRGRRCGHRCRTQAASCRPGCSPHLCGQSYGPNDPHYPWPAKFWCHFRPTQLRAMMRAQPRATPATRPNRSTRRGRTQWEYNEVVLDSWALPWEADLGAIVEAMFVQAGATPTTHARSVQLHRALLPALPALPLVLYDPSSAAPFSPFLAHWRGR